MAIRPKIIVAIGGGDIRLGTTIAIDREIIRLSRKKHPKILFIPTASSDHKRYCTYFERYFGKRLGCRTDILLLLKETPSRADIRRIILRADIVYVGGGNTLKMMKRWRRLGVDHALREAWRRGIVMSGLSAGSICWFQSGHSDSMSFYHRRRWKYINVRGLGLLQGIHCPHFDSHTLHIPRKKHFERMIQRIGGTGIAIENRSAIAFIDDRYRVLSSKKSAGAYRVYKREGSLRLERIPQTKSAQPTRSLFT